MNVKNKREQQANKCRKIENRDRRGGERERERIAQNENHLIRSFII